MSIEDTKFSDGVLGIFTKNF